MKLTRIRLEQLRKFRQAIDIDHLDPGINLFIGPNESGKSTIASAIRAAFFERYRSVAAEALRPAGDSGAAPTIVLDFTLDGRPYQLTKRYLSRPRCELVFGDKRLEGSEAEDRLAELLGYEYAKSGASQAKHRGIPGLLWIEQGNTHELGSAVGHAIEHIRAALGNDPGKTSDDADGVISAVLALRNALLTPSTGTPRGIYAEAIRSTQALTEQCESLQSEAALYRASVDRLAGLRSEHAEDESARPWEQLRQQQRAAERQLDEVNRLSQALQDSARECEQLESRTALLQDRLQSFRQQEQDLALRGTAHEAATLALAQAVEKETRLQRHHADALLRVQQAQDALHAARRRAEADERRKRREVLESSLAAGRKRLEQAMRLHEALKTLQLELAQHALPDAAIEALRQFYGRQRELGIRQDAMATKLEFTLASGVAAQLDEQAIQGSGERLLTQQAALAIAGVGELRITPGGSDLAPLQHQASLVEKQILELRNQYGLTDLAQAEQRWSKAQRLQSEIAMQQRELKLLAADGLEALRQELERLELGLREIPDASGPDNAARQDTAPMSLAEAEHEHALAAKALETAKQQWHKAQLEVGKTQVQAESAQRERDNARSALESPRHQEQQRQYLAQLQEISQALSRARQEQQALQKRITDARPDILAQDIERYRRSADQHQQAHRQRADTLLRLEVELQTLGARGLDEKLAETQQALAHAQRRGEELGRRARALDFLHDLLKTHRHNATQALQAPLQKHLLHYLQLLFPDASLNMTEQLTPGTLIRTDDRGRREELLDLLSHGAREQLGVIGRLAYADLLREAGRPTLLLLDDALVHSDTARLAQMKRVLFDAAKRHQILLFSCHPQAWTDLGVHPRSMDSLAAASG